MGVYVRLREAGGATWAGCTLGVTNASGNATWTFNDQFNLPRASVYDVAEDFVSWHNDAARPWTGVSTASWAKGTTPANGRVEVKLSATVSTTWAVSADLTTLTDWRSGTGFTVTDTNIGALGTVDVQLSVSNFIEHDESAGVFSQSNSWVNGSGQFATRRPTVSGVLTELQAFALSDALRVAANPRQVVVYEKHGATHRTLDLGDVTLTRGRDLYRVDMVAIG